MKIIFFAKITLNKLIDKYCVPNSFGYTPYEVEKTLEEVQRIISAVNKSGLKDSEFMKGLIFTDSGIDSMRKYLSGNKNDIKKYFAVNYIAEQYMINHDLDYISVDEVDLMLKDPLLTNKSKQDVKMYLMENRWDIDGQKFRKSKFTKGDC